MSYTEGKWNIYKTEEGDAVAIYDGTAKRMTIADFRIASRDQQETNANARLISASPIMYEFIKSKAEEGDENAKSIIAEIRL